MTSKSRESWPGQSRATAGQSRATPGQPRATTGRPGSTRAPSGAGSGPPTRKVAASRGERRRLSHLDRVGRPRMVDISAKPPSARRAVAEATVMMDQETLTLIIDGAGPKGDVLSVAELAGIMAAKRTAELIPLCHPLPLSDVSVEIRPDRKAGALHITSSATTVAASGVEMEALTAASIAALTVYDMVKSADRGVTIGDIRLLEKSGGKSGAWRRPASPGAPTGSRATAPKRARNPRKS